MWSRYNEVFSLGKDQDTSEIDFQTKISDSLNRFLKSIFFKKFIIFLFFTFF